MRTIIFLLVLAIFILSSANSFCQVTVDFTSSQTTGCSSVNASFTDQSTSTAGGIVEWDWDLDGVTSSSVSPGHIYNTIGTYTICLTVTDDQGNEGTLCKDNYIEVLDLPVPDFTADPLIGCSPLTVAFEDLSTSPSGAIVQWVWGVGGSGGVIMDDGTAPEIVTTYSAADEYSISLTVTDENGCENTLLKNDFITAVDEPILDFTADNTTACTAPAQVNFTNTAIQPGVNYLWNFGNGSTFNGATPPGILYGANGVYTVTLIGVHAASGCTDTLVYENYIKIGASASFTYTPQEGCEDLVVDIVDTSTEPADSVWWSFGDGNFSTAANPTHTYTSPGCYLISLIRYNAGCNASLNAPTCINVKASPNAVFNIDNPLGCTLPHDVNFTSQANGSNTYEWSFGDGSSSTDQTPTHAYDTFGVYLVTLNVTSWEGCTSTTTDTVRVFSFESNYITPEQKDCTPLSIELASNSNSYVPVTNWEWTVINNTTAPAVIETSTDEFPQMILTDTGRYEIQLISTNALGCIDTATFTDRIAVGMLPDVDFSVDPDTACVEEPITFTNLSSGYMTEWEWDFGDGGVSEEEQPVHEYTSVGPFSINLDVFHHGCMNSLYVEDAIYIDPPLAGFNVVTSCIDHFTIEIEDTSIGATSMFYDFGVDGVDTDTTSITNPTFTYPAEGNYLINQYVSNDTTGCVDTLTQNVTIGVPQAIFDIQPRQGCVPMDIEIIDLSNFGSGYTFEWLGSGDTLEPGTSTPTETLLTAGTYTDLKLVITDINGCQDSIVFTDTIYANQVNPGFEILPPAGCEPFTTTFTDTSSSVFGNINQWEWTVVELPGVNLTDQDATYTFDSSGWYDIHLEVTDDLGCSATEILTNGVYVTFPHAEFEADTFGCTISTIDFTALPTGDGLSFLWDFGDGMSSVDSTVTHQYSQEGSYTVCLTVTDINGCEHTTCKQDYVQISNPVAAFTADTTSGFCPPLLVGFENLSQNASSFEWNFGDNSGLSNEVDPLHIYITPGLYDVTLIAGSVAACRDTLILSPFITLEGPVGSFTVDQDTSCTPAPITFVANSLEEYNFTWDFGNGDQSAAQNVVYDSIVYTYQSAGRFVPKLILEDDAGCTRVIESPDTIIIASLEIDFMATDTALCAGETSTNFINQTTSSDPIIFNEWTFPGAIPYTSDFHNVGVEYDTLGLFDVQLIVDNGICRDTFVKPDYIGIGGVPEVDFVADPTSGCDPLTVQFTDQSSVANSTIASWDWSFGDQANATDQNPSHVFEDTLNSTFNVTLTVSSEVGCTETSNELIIVYPLPAVSFQEPATICQGESFSLVPLFGNDTTGYLFQWDAHPTLSCTDCVAPTVHPLDTTTYTLTTTNAFGCTTVESVTLNVRPFAVPVITLSADTSICLGNIVQFQVAGGDDLSSYQWDSSITGLSCYDACINPVASPQVTTTYVVTVTNEGGCLAHDSVTVTVIDDSSPFAGEDRTICEGDSIQLLLTSGNNPEWVNPENLSCTYCEDPVAFPTQTISYVVTATSDIGCALRDTLEVTVIPSSAVDAGDDLVICDGEATDLAGVGEGVVTWTPNTGMTNANSLTPNVTPVFATTYYMTVANGDCILQDSVLVEVNENTEISGMDMTICYGDTVTLEIFGEADSYTWRSDVSLSELDISDPAVAPESTTTYVVTGQFSTCNPDTASVTIYVNELPEFKTQEVRFFVPGQTVELDIVSLQAGALEYQWSPLAGLSCSTCASPAVTPDSTTTYTLTVTDVETGCVDVRTVTIQQLYACPEELFGVPNAFSPNGDGFNDELELKISPSIENIEVFRVFNRWGALVFETTDKYDSWDGTFKGQPLDEGVYLYMLEVKCALDGELIMKRGDITILR